MRKLFALMFAVILVMAGVPASADGYSDMMAKAENYLASGDYQKAIASYQLAAVSVRNAALDAAFDRSDLTLVKAEFPEVTVEKFVFSDEMWAAVGVEKPADPIAAFNGYLPNAAIDWLSLSPAGNSGLLTAGGNIGVCYYAGQFRVLYPSHTRGAADSNENLAKVYSMGLQRLLGDEGVIYSPDGRYAAVFNVQISVINARFILDPIIIDLSTGEMFLSATYGNKLFKGEGGVVTTAAFSADGRYFYYMLYGNMNEHRTALYRYDLRAETTELCYSGNDFNYYPNLSETGNGAFVMLRDVTEKEGITGLTGMTYKDGAWAGNEQHFDLPMKYWYCNRLLLSANSGYAFVPGRIGSTGGWYYGFQRIRPDDDFDGLNQYYYISKESGQIEACSAEEIRGLFDGLENGSTQEDTSTLALDMPFQSLLTFTLSPDGQYVLLNTLNAGTREHPERSRHLYLLRLDDLAIKEVRGIDPEDIPTGNLARYRPMIEWHTDTLIIGTTDGIQAYTFQLQ